MKLHAIPIHKINNAKYIELNDFITTNKCVKYSWDPLSLNLEIECNDKSVQAALEKNYYTSEGKQYYLNSAPIYKDEKIFLPLEFTEELFSELNFNINYKFDSEEIKIEDEAIAGNDEKDFSLTKNYDKLDFIIIDPGHGGKDPGAFAAEGLAEKKITLSAGRIVYYALKKAFPQIKIYSTRFKDKFITLEKRAQIANSKIKKDEFGIFISLHCNATLSKKTNGYEIYYLSQSEDNEESREIMLRENQYESENELINTIESILFNSQIQAESKTLARQINSSLMTYTDNLVKGRGVKKADFAVLRGVLMPAVLIEMGYLSNKREAGVIVQKSFQEKLAEGIIEGIRGFLKKRPRL
ncbi:MAG: N-acetylmuramoyl-L-alanine amidase [Spirochaetia bacterium]|nr:N-acetylmuramoyl-L-alanine amidase [Spirochaetia bacterium]